LHTSSGNYFSQKAQAIHASAGINLGESGGGLLSCGYGEFVLAGILRGYGAYRIKRDLVRLEDYSISSVASDIQIAMGLSYNDY
jgi:hypothetical protein